MHALSGFTFPLVFFPLFTRVCDQCHIQVPTKLTLHEEDRVGTENLLAIHLAIEAQGSKLDDISPRAVRVCEAPPSNRKGCIARVLQTQSRSSSSFIVGEESTTAADKHHRTRATSQARKLEELKADRSAALSETSRSAGGKSTYEANHCLHTFLFVLVFVMSAPIPGWPLWQRVNMFVLTVGGGFIGFYLQDMYKRRHKDKLREEVPKLSGQLAELTARRVELEGALRDAQAENSL